MTNNMTYLEARTILANELDNAKEGETKNALLVACALLNRVGDGEIITTVNRDDIMGLLDADDKPIYAGRTITDSDLREVAEDMADAYCENVFWIDLPIVCESVLGKADLDVAFSGVNADER